MSVCAELADDLAGASLAVARWFTAGATLWCVAPAWPQHAAHLAVEFVHPVVVGVPARPAVALPGEAAAAFLRANARRGDVLALIAPAEDAVAKDLALRAQALGLNTVWLGAGDGPAPGAADRVLWLSGEPDAPFDGGLVLLYHLLWELTSVCFEHPGLLEPAPECTGPVCVTCADEGNVAEVVGATDTTATVRTAGRTERVDVTLVGAVSAGDLLLVHAGSAIARLPQ